MALDIFGFQLTRKKNQEENEQIPSVVTPMNDGSLVQDSSINAGGLYTYGVDMDGIVKNENETIRRYREIALYPEVDFAIEDICNEAIVSDQEENIVTLNLDELKISESIKTKMKDSFEEVLQLLDFNKNGWDIFRQWYVDGRISYHLLFKDNNTKNGLDEVRLIDPFKIKKIKEIKRERSPKGVEVIKQINEYFIYNDRGIQEGSLQGVKLSLDSVVYVTSGLQDSGSGLTIGFLQKAVKPTNQLKMMEDSLVIYRMSRAPERRIFYIDVGDMPKMKAEQYVKDMMDKFRNKLVYDAKTGEIADAKKNLSLMEDFWMPRRNGGKGTEITTLAGGQNLSQIEDIQYFLNKLYRALNVPITRLQPETGFSIGRSNEISRDEVRFGKFIDKLRLKFSNLFLDLLKIQFISKGIISLDEWEDIKQKIKFDFSRDNHFTELKESEILNNRLQTLAQMDQFVGKYFSRSYIQKKVLRFTDEEIENINKENEEDSILQQEQEQQQQEPNQQG